METIKRMLEQKTGVPLDGQVYRYEYVLKAISDSLMQEKLKLQVESQSD